MAVGVEVELCSQAAMGAAGIQSSANSIMEVEGEGRGCGWEGGGGPDARDLGQVTRV